MKRLGNSHRPFYRIVSVDERLKRDGKVIEELGTYNPLEKDEAAQVEVNLDRAAYWLSVGAQPSGTVATLLTRRGLVAKAGTKLDDQPADLEAAAAEATAKYAEARQEAARKKAQEKAEAEAQAKAAAEAEAKAAAEAKVKEEAEAKAAEEAAAAEKADENASADTEAPASEGDSEEDKKD